jgi:hypothetical protein
MVALNILFEDISRKMKKSSEKAIVMSIQVKVWFKNE